jgi:K+-transporting ATPase ATPase A chain
VTALAVFEVVVSFALLTALAVPLGAYMARVYEGEARFGDRAFGGLERAMYRLAGIDPAEDMGWARYAGAVLSFNLAGLLVLYVLLRLQGSLAPGGARFVAVTPWVAWNTAVSFASNTNWQAYAGETLAPAVQMLGLTVQNFLSAATGMAVLVALVRGFTRRSAGAIGNFWVDLTRSTLHVLLPLAAVLALILVSQGVVQTFRDEARFPLFRPDGARGEQVVALGPVASQVAIKQLGTNGGGFFNANSAHPLENPTPLSSLAQLIAILLVPTALCFTFGNMVRRPRQGWALYAAMLAIALPLTLATVAVEQDGNPLVAALGVDDRPGALLPGGNMEGKEARFGPVGSGIWAVWTTAASNGSVNSMHDSYMPVGGMVQLWLMQLGEVVFGGVGSGLYGMLFFAIVAVFVAGLMVGRTPEFLGKKLEAFEMKMAILAILLPSAAVLLGTAAASVLPAGFGAAQASGPHGFSELLYGFASQANNNGSAFAGLTASGPFWATAGGVAMLVGRYLVIVCALGVAGSLARKKVVAASAGTLPTEGALFVGLLVGTVLLVGALTFLPALALGPVVEHLRLYAAGG